MHTDGSRPLAQFIELYGGQFQAGDCEDTRFRMPPQISTPKMQRINHMAYQAEITNTADSVTLCANNRYFKPVGVIIFRKDRRSNRTVADPAVAGNAGRTVQGLY